MRANYARLRTFVDTMRRLADIAQPKRIKSEEDPHILHIIFVHIIPVTTGRLVRLLYSTV